MQGEGGGGRWQTGHIPMMTLSSMIWMVYSMLVPPMGDGTCQERTASWGIKCGQYQNGAQERLGRCQWRPRISIDLGHLSQHLLSIAWARPGQMKVEPWIHCIEKHLGLCHNSSPVLETRGRACKNTGMWASSKEARNGSCLRV